MALSATLYVDIKALSAEAFARKYPHAWLIREIAGKDASPGTFKTSTAPGDLPEHPAPSRRCSRLISGAPERFELIAVAKNPDNPWQERITVGRAKNNDVVIRDASVSKVHAHFTVHEVNRYVLHDRKSANGTMLDGVRLDPAGEGAPVPSGSMIHFGNVLCEFILSPHLFELLAG